MRSFIAIETTDAIRQKLSITIQELKAHVKGVKWVWPENAHVTMYFLGDIREEERSLIERVIQTSIHGVSPFTASVEGISGFPSITSPRVLWAGIHNETGELQHIYKMLVRGFEESDAHIKREKSRDFTPHITIGRVKRREDSLVRTLDTVKERAFGQLPVRAVVLFKSTLTRKGPVYERISVFPLK